MARRALARACAIASPWLEARNEMLDIVSKPTAMIVNRIINESVTTKAKPGFQEEWIGDFIRIE
jgi:hypothetical protein